MSARVRDDGVMRLNALLHFKRHAYCFVDYLNERIGFPSSRYVIERWEWKAIPGTACRCVLLFSPSRGLTSAQIGSSSMGRERHMSTTRHHSFSFHPLQRMRPRAKCKSHFRPFSSSRHVHHIAHDSGRFTSNLDAGTQRMSV
jgi:hypothetical protein